MANMDAHILKGIPTRENTPVKKIPPTDVPYVIKQSPNYHVFTSLEDVADILHGDRSHGNAMLEFILENGARSPIESLILQLLQGELFHVRFVRDVMSSLTQSKSDHDWSKDYVYMATTCIAYSLKRADLLEDILQQETERHFQLEGHHPESIQYTKELMTEAQILEMAIDRLSRNLQFNKGEVKMAEMLSYEPRMRKCPECGGGRLGSGKCEHEERMLGQYWAFIHQHLAFVQSRWLAMVQGQLTYLDLTSDT